MGERSIVGISREKVSSESIARTLTARPSVTTSTAPSIPSRRTRAPEASTRATFDQLTIDGDMSTNDSVFVLANGGVELLFRRKV